MDALLVSAWFISGIVGICVFIYADVRDELLIEPEYVLLAIFGPVILILFIFWVIYGEY